MNISAERFTTKARTWLFIAGLTALLIGIGALIGGMFLYAFVALAVVVNVLGYWFSDRLALKASGAKPVEPGTNPELEAMVQDLAQRARVPVPRLYTIPSEQPNAFATGRNPEHAAVAVTNGLLQQLPPEQVKSVLARVRPHQEPRHPRLLDRRARRGRDRRDRECPPVLAALRGDEEDAGPLGWIGLIGTIIIAPLAAALLQLAVSRQREYLADATGADLLGRASPLADTLEELESRSQASPLDLNPATASLYIVNPLRRQGVATLFSTHPPITERVRRLRALHGDQTLQLVA
jgi:heat shock protein HtpX